MPFSELKSTCYNDVIRQDIYGRPSDRISGGSYNFMPLGGAHNHNYFRGGRPNHYQDSLLIAATTPAPYQPRPSTTVQPREIKYHLQGFPWALSLLDDASGSLIFSSNGKNVSLEVSKDSDPPKSSNGDEACSNSVELQKGEAASEGGAVCVYLTRCAAAADLAVDAYSSSYCTVNNRYAGVCCPSNQVDVKKA